MKKFKLAVAALLAVGAFAVASCSKSADSDAAAAVTPGDAETLNIRYVNMVSVLSNYTLAQELMTEQQRMLLEYQNQGQAKEAELQRFYQTIQQKAQNNVYLTPESARADEQSFYNRQAEAQRWSQQREQQIAIAMNEQRIRLNDSIRNVIRDLSVANHFDAVLDDTVAYYVNPELDVTDAVIAALNARYKGTAETAAPAPAAAPAAPAAPAK